jgi:hypothetical protein
MLYIFAILNQPTWRSRSVVCGLERALKRWELTSLGIAEVLILASVRGSEVQGLPILLSHLHPQSDSQTANSSVVTLASDLQPKT